MTTIAASNVAAAPGQSTITQGGSDVYAARHQEALAYISSPEQRARVEKMVAKVNQLYDRPGQAHTFRNAGEAASYGGMLTGILTSAVSSVNAAQDFLDPKFLDQIRATGGEELATRVRGSSLKDLARSQRLLSRMENEIGGSQFAISGTLVQRHDDGRVSLGAYALTFSGSGFGVRVGSDGSAFVAQGDGPYQRYEADRMSDGLSNKTESGLVSNVV